MTISSAGYDDGDDGGVIVALEATVGETDRSDIAVDTLRSS